MEQKLSTLARADYERLFGDHVNRFKALLIARTTRFDGTYHSYHNISHGHIVAVKVAQITVQHS